MSGQSGKGVSVAVRTSSGEQNIEGSDILVAAGRVPNTAGIGLDEAGIELDSRGYVRVNDRLETSAPDVWALGECAGSPQFTHISEDDFRIVRDNLAGGRRSTRDRLVPYCMFTDPPLAHVGLSEREAERQGVKTRVARLPMSAVLRAQATGEKTGFMKALVGESDDRILGFTMIGAEAGEVMAVVQTAMLARLAIHAAPRRRSRASDHGRGARLPVLERAAAGRDMKTNANLAGWLRQRLALSRSRCAACLARLPQIAMLHHRRARLLVWSAKMSVQLAPSHALMLAKSSSQTHCASASPIGSSNEPGDRHRRIVCSSRRSPSPSRRPVIWLNALIALQKRVQRLEFAERLGGERPAHVVAHEDPEPLAESASLVGDFREVPGRRSRRHCVERARWNEVGLSQPCDETLAAVEPVDTRIDRRRDRVEEIEARRVGDEERRRFVRHDGLSNQRDTV